MDWVVGDENDFDFEIESGDLTNVQTTFDLIENAGKPCGKGYIEASDVCHVGESDAPNITGEGDEQEKATIAGIAHQAGVKSDVEIAIASDGQDYKIGDWSFKAAANYNPTTKTITLFNGARKGALADMLAIVSHEYGHHEYSSAMQEYRDQENAALNDPQDVVYPSGKLKPEFAGKYPVFAAIGPLWNGDDYGKLSKDDGVTGYSKKWWEKWNTNKTQGWSAGADLGGIHVPINETYAEVRALKFADRKEYQKSVSSTWKKFAMEVERAARYVRNK